MPARVDLTADLATDLFHTVGRFRRQLRRTAGGSFAGVTQSQAELLRLVGRQPGISVREAAEELGLAANTASTLVSKLTADNLLVRSTDPGDRRIGRLQLTEPAQQLADQTRAARRSALGAVLNQLDDEQIDDLTKGLNVLAEMTRMLQESQP
ncbi:MarR family winged helix-turn-helix transcriptional regulator [Mycolicibacterium llatzerense]|uniref:MarR family winged helix-turn-helix transcriptional regulator n=1 Tax=Mycolicibacterium llatzerense TaxID=280871 RepID=UPI0021B6B11A|nr:MarR family transcriptional regulator [Mycolicibacterium llatzerense]MCT7362522.1 MarR family transcriptional regulator [Mycolicibacterium llatzerense]